MKEAPDSVLDQCGKNYTECVFLAFVEQNLIGGASDAIRRRFRFMWLALGLLSELGQWNESSGGELVTSQQARTVYDQAIEAPLIALTAFGAFSFACQFFNLALFERFESQTYSV